MDVQQHNNEKISGAEAVIKCLLRNNVNIVFGYPGGAIMPIYDAHYSYADELKHILVRHEQGAIHAAQGYARASGKIGVCFATSGPGATNLVTGIADAYIDSTPLVCITGQVHSAFLGTDAFQETDVMGISMPITKWSYQITKAEEIPEILAKAFYIANSGRPGPVLIDITKDAQIAKFNFSYQEISYIRTYRPIPKPSYTSIEEAAELINKAQKPFLIWGQGIIISNAENEMIDLLEKTGIPAASTILGLSAMPSSHPLYVGMLGMHGNLAPNILTNECDVLIAIGMRFDDRVTGNTEKYAKQATIIHIDIDPAEINKNIPSQVSIIGDAKDVLQKLNPLLIENEHNQWLQQFKDLYQREFNELIDKEIYPSIGAIQMGEAIEEINKQTNHNAILVSDVGQHQMHTCRYGKFNQTRTKITSGGLGTMGFGLPAAIGAKLAQKEKTVISISGDGGIQMNIQELGTIMQEKLNVKIVILNNEYLGMVRQWQELFFENRYASTPMQNPNYQLIAKAYNIETLKVSERKDLEDAITSMLNHNGPFLLEIMVGKELNIFPMIEPGKSVSEIKIS